MTDTRIGTVTAVAATATIDLGGVEIPGVPYTQVPRVGDNVLLLVRGDTDYVIIGALGGGSAHQTGSYMYLEDTTADYGWLLCDGSTFDGDDYPRLAAHLGGTTLPDLRGRFLVGADTNHALGSTGGTRLLQAHPHGVGSLTIGAPTVLDSGFEAGSGASAASIFHGHPITGSTGQAVGAVVQEPPWRGVHTYIWGL